jgi:hypothetical protein
MKTLMNDTQLETLDQVRLFMEEGTEAVSFRIESKDMCYRWLQHNFGEVSLSATQQDR